MSMCLKEEQLQALVDNELGEREKDSVSEHVAGCSACRGKLESIQSSTVRLNSILNSLVPDGQPVVSLDSVIELPHRTSAPAIGWTGVGTAAAIAAIILVALIFGSRGPVAPKSPDMPIVTHAPAVVESAVNRAAPLTHHATVPVRIEKPQPMILTFHALDDGGPIESGLVYRVSLPVPSIGNPGGTKPTKTVPAEVIVDEAGQVRAIRFLQ